MGSTDEPTRQKYLQSRLMRALSFAAVAHEGQVRKYTGEPYVNHCMNVAVTLSTYGYPEDVVIGGLLHDTIEDTGVAYEDIWDAFGTAVADLVLQVTDVSRPWDGNREQRKAKDRAYVAKASPEAKAIKLADLIDNTRSIVAHDRDFAKVYLREKDLLLEAIGDNHNPELYARARQMCNDSQLKIRLGEITADTEG